MRVTTSATHDDDIRLAEPFRIGVRPLPESAWLRADEDVPTRVLERQRLHAHGAAIYGAVAGTETAQQEAYDLVVRWHARFGRLRDHRSFGNTGTGGPPLPGLLRAGLVAAEDLALMRRDAAGWRLVAGAIAFPSLWRLSDKLGHVMAEVHGPVPGFGPGSDAARVIERMFDALPPSRLVERGNWTLHDTDTLHLPEHPPRHDQPPDDIPGCLPRWLRRERQTLRKLPISGDILFTIDVLLTPTDRLSAGTRHWIESRVGAYKDAQRRYRNT